MMRNIKIIISYDGTRYNGWQKQGNTKNTIQEKLEHLLSKMTGEIIEIHGSGRTDAGVHALAQAANFHTRDKRTAEEMVQYINRYLPEDIVLLDLRETDERFHSRLHAKRKTYLYRIQNAPHPDVFSRKYMLYEKNKLNLEKMEQAAGYFIGEHDFQAFSTGKRTKKSTVRRIDAVHLEQIGEEIRITFEGNGFLYNMVRIMTGTLIEAGRGEREPESVKEALNCGERQKAGYMVPPHGLYLKSVEYDRDNFK